jgi:hypothetical protein
MHHWEYKVLTYRWDQEQQNLVWSDAKDMEVNEVTVDKRLNELGRKGWELISIEKMSDISHVAVTFYLKRPLEE